MLSATVLLAAAAVALPAFAGGSPTIKVTDNDYSKSKLTVSPGTEVTFKWDDGNSNPHTVTLQKGPNGINKTSFRSKTGETGIKFSPKFRKPGLYSLRCIIHPEDMNIDVEVRKKRN